MPPITERSRRSNKSQASEIFSEGEEYWKEFIENLKDRDILLTGRSWGTSSILSSARNQTPLEKEEIKVWDKVKKAWLTARVDAIEKSKLPGYLHWKNNSKPQVDRLLKPLNSKYPKNLRSQTMDYYSESARKNEEQLIKMGGGGIRFARINSDLTNHVNSIISTNGILMKNDSANPAYGSSSF